MKPTILGILFAFLITGIAVLSTSEQKADPRNIGKCLEITAPHQETELFKIDSIIYADVYSMTDTSGNRYHTTSLNREDRSYKITTCDEYKKEYNDFTTAEKILDLQLQVKLLTDDVIKLQGRK